MDRGTKTDRNRKYSYVVNLSRGFGSSPDPRLCTEGPETTEGRKSQPGDPRPGVQPDVGPDPLLGDYPF